MLLKEFGRLEYLKLSFVCIFIQIAPAIIQPGDNVTNVIPGGSINYYQTSCSEFSNQVLVELIDVRGTSFLFASGTVTNPGPLTSNTQSNTTMAISRKTVTVTLSSSSKVLLTQFI